ncbi:uncharacterized protein LOC127750505 [Frankliniella occidentalis]|uniref:Uncharacterized protein LOC127750505 n=1 Tax=Frankliniella occidentalis TaxID=133901 RepID=A0A9C6XR73_FRAOC|nr:uncharacterized protein LOC127750505 [Frankliniella occidentalis]
MPSTSAIAVPDMPILEDVDEAPSIEPSVHQQVEVNEVPEAFAPLEVLAAAQQEAAEVEEASSTIPMEVFRRRKTRVQAPPTPAAKRPLASVSGPSFVESTQRHPMGVVPSPVFHLPPPQPHMVEMIDNIDMRQILNAKRAKRAKMEGTSKKRDEDPL